MVTGWDREVDWVALAHPRGDLRALFLWLKVTRRERASYWRRSLAPALLKHDPFPQRTNARGRFPLPSLSSSSIPPLIMPFTPAHPARVRAAPPPPALRRMSSR